jgi:hypothetical protein
MVGDAEEVAQKGVRMGLEPAVGAVSSDELVHLVTAAREGILTKAQPSHRLQAMIVNGQRHQAFYMVGGIEQAIEKAERIEAGPQ